MIYADTHSHILDGQFDGVRDELIKSFDKAGVDFIIENGTNIEDSRSAVELSEKYSRIYCAVGIHPENCGRVTDNDFISLEHLLDSSSKIVAIGEIALDYHYGNDNKAKQIEIFEYQLALAERYKIPVIIHSRDAVMDTFDVVSKYNVRGALHCFSGSLDFAHKYIDRGFLIGIGGTITFKNARKNIEVLKAIPIESVITETDCPYLAPEPLRGKVNSPLNIPYVIEKIAIIKNMYVDMVAEITLSNAKLMYAVGE